MTPAQPRTRDKIEKWIIVKNEMGMRYLSFFIRDHEYHSYSDRTIDKRGNPVCFISKEIDGVKTTIAAVAFLNVAFEIEAMKLIDKNMKRKI